MAVETAAGASISISATPPPTQDQAGYEDAAVIYSPIGEVTDIPEFGDASAEVTHTPLSTRLTQKFKGSVDAGSISISLGVDRADAGQVLLRAAKDSVNALYTFRVQLDSGDKTYFQARVMSFTTAVGTIDSIVSGTALVAISTFPVEVAA